jgi:hypothetical protein
VIIQKERRKNLLEGVYEELVGGDLEVLTII